MILDATFSENNSTFAPDVEEEGVTFSAQFSGGVGSGSGSGENGATFIPSVSEDGIISWTNDKGLANPKPVNIKGDEGDKGERGADGKSGVYILGEGESLDNVPEDVSVVIDPDGEGGGAIDLKDVVRYTPQALNTEQQQQARTNINTYSTEEIGSAVNMATGNSLKWDGVVRDRHYIEGDGDFPIGFYHITDEVPTFIEENGQPIGCVSYTMYGYPSYMSTPPLPITFLGATEENASIYIADNMFAIMVVGSNTVGRFKKGVYFSTIIDPDVNLPLLYVSSLQVLGYSFKPQNSELVLYVQDEDEYLYKDIDCTQKATISDLTNATVHNVTLISTEQPIIQWAPLFLVKENVGIVGLWNGVKTVLYYTAEKTEANTMEVLQ